MRKYRNQILAGLGFVTVVLIAVITVTGAEAMADRLQDFPLWLLAPVFALKCVNYTLRYIEWRYFLGVIGVRVTRGLSQTPPPDPSAPVIRERDSVVLWLAGLALAVSPGKLAEVLKALVLKNLSGLEFSRGAPVIFMERLVDGLAVIPLTTLALFAMGDSLEDGDVPLTTVRAVLFGVTGALILGMAVAQIKPLAYAVLGKVANWPVIGRFQDALRNLYESAYDMIKARHLIPTTVLGMIAFSTDFTGFYLLLRGLGVEGGWTLFWQCGFILGFSVLIASLSAMPGGAGGRELTIGPLLVSLVGLSKADSGTATFLIGMFQMWVGVLIGLVMIALFRNTLFPPALETEIAAYEAARQPH
jgi:uncharacterized protein (TIRG00374 family)